MELRALSAYVEVVRRGSFSGAAKALGLTQPTITKAIQQLELECGCSLLSRQGRNIRLTSAGETVYRRALTMLSERDHLQDELDQINGLQKGRLRLGLPSLGSSLLFAPLMAKYRQLYPNIDIELHEQGSHPLQEGVRTGMIEIGSSVLPVGDEFESLLVTDQPLAAVLPTGHPLEKRKSLHLKELALTPFILFEEGFALNTVVLNACRKRGFTPTEAARSGHVDFILALVAAGLGVALLPRMIALSRLNAVSPVIPMADKDLRWRLGLIWRRHSDLSPAARRWIDLVREDHTSKTPA